jgi:4,5-dihydroxyphthalate decarboxylase
VDRLRLSIATTDYDHFRDVRTGAVRPVGIQLIWSLLGHHEVFSRFTYDREWDIAELSFAKFMAQVTRPEPDIVALPIACSRVFRFGSFYVSRNSGIRSPEGLAGKRVGSPEWAHTCAVWMRGWLNEEVGVPLQDVHWVQAGANEAGREEKVELHLPDGIELERITDRSLSQLLAAGDVDCAIIARPPSCFLEGHPDVVRLFPDHGRMERDYHTATGVWPIMHLLAMKRGVLDEHPWVARNLLNESKDASVERLLDPAVSRYPLPWVPPFAQELVERFDGDPFPFGVEPNRPTFERFLRYTAEQGIAKRHVRPEEIFPSGIDTAIRVWSGRCPRRSVGARSRDRAASGRALHRVADTARPSPAPAQPGSRRTR